MEHREAAETTWKSYPERFLLAATICILVGVGLFIGCMVLDGYATQSRRIGLGHICVLGWYSSIVLVYLAAPLLGIVALCGMRTDDQYVARYSDDVEGRKRIRRVVGRFLVASALLVLAALLPVIVRIARGGLELWFVGLALVGVQMGRQSRRLARAAGLHLPWGGMLLMGVVGAVLVAVVLGTTGISSYIRQRVAYASKAETFSGSSERLERTTVVPTLDSPMPMGRNVIWCSSFQLAWNEVKDKVLGAPLEVVGAEELAARLNTAPQSALDVDADSVYVAAGRIRQGIIARIERDMAAKFPSHKLPDFNEYNRVPEGILSYSFLRANVPFKHPFRQLDEALTFRDSEGTETQVAGFGLWQAFLPRCEKVREQVEILYSREAKDRDRLGQLEEYALDLCRHSEPYQVVVAVVEPRGSLAYTLEYIRLQTVEFKDRHDCEEASRLDRADVVKIPEMFWRIDHRFRELIGKVVVNANPAMPIIEALQTIEFRLDRSGAMLESESNIAIAAIPRKFAFNRPFLIYMQKRDAEQPFFVMWVDNAELLVPK